MTKAYRRTLVSGMQRLYTIFPDGAAGVGLLLLRSLAGSLAVVGMTSFLSAEGDHSIEAAAMILSGLLLLVGLWTPLMGIGFAVTYVVLLMDRGIVDFGCLAIPTIGISIALLGPGAWSVDARLFGRKTIEIDKS